MQADLQFGSQKLQKTAQDKRKFLRRYQVRQGGKDLIIDQIDMILPKALQSLTINMTLHVAWLKQRSARLNRILRSSG